MSELLPCPFCGGEAHIRETFDVIGWTGDEPIEQLAYVYECDTQDCQVYVQTKAYPTVENATTAWNTRAERTCEWREDVDGGLYCYDTECGREYRWPVLPLPSYCPGCGARVVRE